mmetsp:Transcript_26286/g.42975  ORF Transcript_26286/g.42975 Transcript_26286/m.42975 type:complete len:321 (+) Transcript_26286:124-1086(+)
MAEASGAGLKAWMKKQDIFDNDLLNILSEQGVNDADADFKTYTQAQWDDLWRRGYVERCKELKDQKAKVNMEKKMKKLEKHWRKESGVKSTSIKEDKSDEKDAPEINNSAASQAAAIEQGQALKKYLQKNDCYNVDLLMVLVNAKITNEEEIASIESNKAWDEIYRQVRVLRTADLKDQAAKVRMEKLMAKFEKLWRAKTGVKKTSIRKSSNAAKKKKDPTTKKNEQLAKDGATLKAWMRKNDVWEMALYDELMANNVNSPEALKEITQGQFDEIVRKVRVDRFSQLKDQAARNRADKLLVKFEKEWRKATGIKKTSLKK